MRRLLALGLFLGGCMGGPGGDSDVDGQWLSTDQRHTLLFRAGWFEAADPDPGAWTACRIAGAFHVQDGVITLVRTSYTCPEAPTVVEWRGEEILRDGGAVIYKRWDGKPTLVDIPADDPTTGR
jgi:hypothetical protein